MVRKPSPSIRTTLYRLVELADLATAIKPKYLTRDEFSQNFVTVGEREALLVHGTMVTDIVSWASTAHGLTGCLIELGNQTAAAVLLIRNGDGAWALTYGMGFQLLDYNKLDPGFGQRVAIRTADANALNSLTRTTLDHRSRTDRFSIPSGEHLRGFGVGDFGELVTRLVARARIEGLTAGDDELGVRGADALSVPLARAPEALIADLDTIDRILAKDAPPELAVLEQLVAIKHQPELTTRLEGNLGRRLAGDVDAGKLALAWPHERIDENGTPSSFKVTGVGRYPVQDGIPQLDTILELLDVLGPEERLEKIDRLQLILFRDAEGDEPISTAIPVRKWLAFETPDDSRRYCLHDGTWYRMASDYAAKLSHRVKEIFARDSEIRMPNWPLDSKENEAAYNKRAAETLNGVLLDQKFVYTNFHRRGIEMCDILLKDGTLIHVKNMDSSAPASHLLAQALVSADALRYDEQARQEFERVVIRSGGNAEDVPTSIERVVLAVARKTRPITADDLFTFTQVNLVRQATALESQGVHVFVAPITRT
jgi:uncharacterized protein (TIGR04141 family)